MKIKICNFTSSDQAEQIEALCGEFGFSNAEITQMNDGKEKQIRMETHNGRSEQDYSTQAFDLFGRLASTFQTDCSYAHNNVMHTCNVHVSAQEVAEHTRRQDMDAFIQGKFPKLQNRG